MEDGRWKKEEGRGKQEKKRWERFAKLPSVIDSSFLSDQMKLPGLDREWEKAKGFSTLYEFYY